MSTFDELGIPFPLFAAPTSAAAGYVGAATCRLCGMPDSPCFELGLGDDLMFPCPSCLAITGLNSDDQADGTCPSCRATVPFPESLRSEEPWLVCHTCLRQGKVSLTKDTELGMVTWEHAIAGQTHGIPGNPPQGFETILIPDDDGAQWYASRVASAHLWELLKTPTYYSWQGERWLFCCGQPMTFLGGETRSIPEDQFPLLFSPDDPAREWGIGFFEAGKARLDLFRCRSCGRHRANHDCD